MDNLIDVHRDLENAASRVIQVLLKQAFKCLLNENLHDSAEVSFEIKDERKLVLKTPVCLKFKTYYDGDFHNKDFFVKSLEYSFHHDQYMVFHACGAGSWGDTSTQLFEVRLEFDEEEMSYSTSSSYWSSSKSPSFGRNILSSRLPTNELSYQE